MIIFASSEIKNYDTKIQNNRSNYIDDEEDEDDNDNDRFSMREGREREPALNASAADAAGNKSTQKRTRGVRTSEKKYGRKR
jgi:hypothetical protein